jgi:hypothetical protein
MVAATADLALSSLDKGVQAVAPAWCSEAAFTLVSLQSLNLCYVTLHTTV